MLFEMFYQIPSERDLLLDLHKFVFGGGDLLALTGN